MSASDRFARLPTAAKIFFMLTAAILPIGLALVWLGATGIREANGALQDRSHDQAREHRNRAGAGTALEELVPAAGGRAEDDVGERMRGLAADNRDRHRHQPGEAFPTHPSQV